MKQSDFKVVTLEASPDKYITQTGDVHIKDRIIATIIVVGKNDSVDNYKEIGKEEGDKYLEAQKEYFASSSAKEKTGS